MRGYGCWSRRDAGEEGELDTWNRRRVMKACVRVEMKEERCERMLVKRGIKERKKRRFFCDGVSGGRL